MPSTNASHFSTASPPSSFELFFPAAAGDMGRTENAMPKSHLDVILDAPFLTLKGTGPDVEPTSLSGHVALFLTESTSIKEITLQFRGKAKIPMPASESLINSGTSITYVVCSHDWSFLEGDKRHSRTLKAGRHFFPFHLEIGGTLPSSISTNALGGASVSYKLRASALRPGLAHNLQANVPVYIVRSFTHEALEYQQTLEIENTWPEKLMYSIMLPHKAWAAGDTLVAVLKFSPLSKGVSVASIVSSLHETTKTYARSGAQEETRAVCSVRHEIIGGRAIEIDSTERTHRPHSGTHHGFSFASAAASITVTPLSSRPSSPHGHRPLSGPSNSRDVTHEYDEFENHDIVTYVKLHLPPSCHLPTPSPSLPTTPGGSEVPHTTSSSPSTPPLTSNPFNPSAASYLTPAANLVTPSHTLEPIVISHRVRWSIFLRNRDGHTSELRCSLPVVILDGRIREEARSMSVPTRRLMLGSVGLGGGHGDWGEDAFGFGYHAPGQGPDDEEANEDDAVLDEDRELPSYKAHVRDRVANMFLPETVTVRVSNPWLGPQGAPAGSGLAASADAAPSGAASPYPAPVAVARTSSYFPETREHTTANSAPYDPITVPSPVYQPIPHQLPHAPGLGERTPLDWVNSELLMSLTDDPLGADATAQPSPRHSMPPGIHTPPVQPQYVAPHSALVSGGSNTSRGGSRWGSRPASPERSTHTRDSSGRGSADASRAASKPGSRASSPTFGSSANASGSLSGASSYTSTAHPAAFGYGYEALHSQTHSPSSTPSSATMSHAHPHPHPHGQQHHQPHTHHSAHSSAAASTASTANGSVRNLSNLFKATMKPFTALSQHHHHHHVHHHSHVKPEKGKERERGEGTDEPPSMTRSDSGHSSGAPSVAEGSSGHGHDAPGNVYVPGAEVLPPSNSASDVHDIAPRISTNNPFYHLVAAASQHSHSNNPFHHITGAASTPALPAAAHLRKTTPPFPVECPHPAAPATAPVSPSASTAHMPSMVSSQHPSMLHRAITDVPDYAIAARGFIGGVPPLSSMRGLPSYEEAQGRRGAGERMEREEVEEHEEEEEERGIEMRRR